ncbi:hypothetical protein CI109_102568 [Kwoniella shandongensis]|uniref:Endosomal/vacuolar adapter protein YPT35 n=1 Tax=Kwoniella shandongensis TaxID=1734106 RepID=A0A5M6BSF0_9TREE|nr:uncharacterized protein CI109_005816 [Kwoniella shandongensis]KAA5525794.1 hypothetical protein CI109_005816 [Kwoniella shandongensis]
MAPLPPSPPSTAIPTRSTLAPLPPSPSSSTSSLTSEEESFDHLAPAVGTTVTVSTSKNGEKPTLGLRDLVRMHRGDRQKSSTRGGIPTIHSTGISTTIGGARSSEQITSTSTSSTTDNVPSYDEVIGNGDGMTVARSENEVFARQVVIRGWKVVGGKSWTDMGKVGAYVVYDIDIGLRNGGNINILRRYTDFVNLRSALKARYPELEAAIPPLPGKAHISKFSEKFLEDRQPRLQRFLKGVVLHPVMGKGGDGSIVGQWVIGPGG